MLTAIGNLILMVLGIACVVMWIVGLVNWDGKKDCNIDDCEMCPFPPCNDKEK